MLLGFTRLSLAVGETCSVTFTVHPSRLAFYDSNMRFVTEPGAFTFSIGASAADIRAEKTVTLEGQIAEYRQREIVATKVSVV
jgi:beta-glucosidase